MDSAPPPPPPFSGQARATSPDARAPKRRRISGNTSRPPSTTFTSPPQYTPLNTTRSQTLTSPPSSSSYRSLFGPETANPSPSQIQSIDLTDTLSPTSKQNSSAQTQPIAATATTTPAARSPLTSYKCPVCMDTPQNATSTSCGHIFCHRCIHDAIRVGERRHIEEGLPSKSAKGNCPVCRTVLTRVWPAHTKKGLVPMQIKLKMRVWKAGEDYGKASAGSGKVVDRRDGSAKGNSAVASSTAAVIELDGFEGWRNTNISGRADPPAAGDSRRSSDDLDALFNE